MKLPDAATLLRVAKTYHGSVLGCLSRQCELVMCPQALAPSREELGALRKGDLTLAEDIR